MSDHHDLPSLDATELENVTGGAGLDISSMLPLLIARQRAHAAAPPPPPPPLTPTIKVNGVEKQLTNNGNGSYSLSTGDAQPTDLG